MIEQLFDNKELEAETGNGKADIKVIREAITLYHNASEEISNLSNDWIDTPMFRVQAAKIKVQLSNAALKIRDALIKAVQKWSNDTVKHIETTYTNMEVRIRTVPTNEKELVSIREFIKVSRDVT